MLLRHVSCMQQSVQSFNMSSIDKQIGNKFQCTFLYTATMRSTGTTMCPAYTPPYTPAYQAWPCIHTCTPCTALHTPLHTRRSLAYTEHVSTYTPQFLELSHCYAGRSIGGCVPTQISGQQIHLRLHETRHWVAAANSAF